MPILANKRDAKRNIQTFISSFSFYMKIYINKRRILVTDLLPSIKPTFQDLKVN